MTDTPGALSPLDEDGINAVVEEALITFVAVGTLAELKEARLTHTGDAPPPTLANRLVDTLDKADKPTTGKLLGGARECTVKTLTTRQRTLGAAAEEEMLRTEAVGVTIPTSRTQAGVHRPLDVLVDEVCDFFTSMGWSIVEGPEAEYEWFNLDVPNFDADHPARQMQDTFYIDGAGAGAAEEQVASLVSRTRTSPVRARVMLEQQPLFYMACPSKISRSDELDTTHTPVSHQVKSLAADKSLTMAYLKGILDHFIKAMLGPEARIRLHPFFFPFTGPSVEMDLWFPRKKGGAGWIEWGGCGVINPNVLTARSIDPEIYTGSAFGMGLERILMLRHGIADVHDIVENDIHLSQQFGTIGKGN